jgi:hypothetical protein
MIGGGYKIGSSKRGGILGSSSPSNPACFEATPIGRRPIYNCIDTIVMHLVYDRAAAKKSAAAKVHARLLVCKLHSLDWRATSLSCKILIILGTPY